MHLFSSVLNMSNYNFIFLKPVLIFQHDAADAQKEHPRLENAQEISNEPNAQEISNEPQQQRPRHFRQRSASDTTFSKMHLSKASFASVVILWLFLSGNELLVNSGFVFGAEKFNLSSRGKRQSTSDLREIEEEDVLPMVRYLHKQLLKTMQLDSTYCNVFHFSDML